MATVVWGSNDKVQPAQGEMRRFIVRNRVDGTVSGKELLAADTNKVMPIKAGWIVKAFWARLIKHGTMGDVFATVKSANDGWSWLGSYAGGPSWNIGGSAANDTTRGTAGNLSVTGPSCIYGMSYGVGTSASYWISSGGKPFYIDDYMVMYTGTGPSFDGIIDFFLDVLDTNPYENAGVSWSANNL
jgi:hypothetical protein